MDSLNIRCDNVMLMNDNVKNKLRNSVRIYECLNYYYMYCKKMYSSFESFSLSRCGNNFCATHRYAESHDCTFDYKTEGRKLLEQSNPVVSAPKLPKI